MKAREHVESGKKYLAQGNSNRAIQEYCEAIKLDKNCFEAYISRGVAYFSLKDFANAITDYSTAIQLDSTLDCAYYNRGLAYYNQGNYIQAIQDYTRAIKLNPKLDYYYHNRGVAYYELKNYNQAIQDYTKAIELNAKRTNSHYGLSKAYEAQKAYDEANKDSNKDVKLTSLLTAPPSKEIKDEKDAKPIVTSKPQKKLYEYIIDSFFNRNLIRKRCLVPTFLIKDMKLRGYIESSDTTSIEERFFSKYYVLERGHRIFCTNDTIENQILRYAKIAYTSSYDFNRIPIDNVNVRSPHEKNWCYLRSHEVIPIINENASRIASVLKRELLDWEKSKKFTEIIVLDYEKSLWKDPPEQPYCLELPDGRIYSLPKESFEANRHCVPYLNTEINQIPQKDWQAYLKTIEDLVSYASWKKDFFQNKDYLSSITLGYDPERSKSVASFEKLKDEKALDDLPAFYENLAKECQFFLNTLQNARQNKEVSIPTRSIDEIKPEFAITDPKIFNGTLFQEAPKTNQSTSKNIPVITKKSIKPGLVRLYVDFDGTMTQTPGEKTVSSPFYTSLLINGDFSSGKFISNLEAKVAAALSKLENADFGITKEFAEIIAAMKKMNAEIFIVTNNYRQYVTAVLKASPKIQNLNGVTIFDRIDVQKTSKAELIYGYEYASVHQAQVVFTAEDDQSTLRMMNTTLKTLGYSESKVVSRLVKKGKIDSYELLIDEIYDKAGYTQSTHVAESPIDSILDQKSEKTAVKTTTGIESTVTDQFFLNLEELDKDNMRTPVTGLRQRKK